MKESELNTEINRSFLKLGFGYKIPDPHKSVVMVSSKRPFDGFGVVKGNSFYYETKLLKSISAFNFSKLADHQISSLTKIHDNREDKIYPIVFLGFYIPYKGIKLLAFDIEFINKLISNGQKSIRKKELEIYLNSKNLINEEKLNKHKYFELNDLVEKIIYE